MPLSGVVYCDRDNDGVLDPTDPGINGVTVTLTGTDSNGNPIQLTTQTQQINGQDGTYVFNVLAGMYTVTETPRKAT